MSSPACTVAAEISSAALILVGATQLRKVPFVCEHGARTTLEFISGEGDKEQFCS